MVDLPFTDVRRRDETTTTTVIPVLVQVVHVAATNEGLPHPACATTNEGHLRLTLNNTSVDIPLRVRLAMDDMMATAMVLTVLWVVLVHDLKVLLVFVVLLLIGSVHVVVSTALLVLMMVLKVVVSVDLVLLALPARPVEEPRPRMSSSLHLHLLRRHHRQQARREKQQAREPARLGPPRVVAQARMARLALLVLQRQRRVHRLHCVRERTRWTPDLARQQVVYEEDKE